ncbi:endolytic transglycosylase MltG [Kiloniella sp. b19]|uniref:endolytic transglycosylase MltG n=1 Tax=Kiloniella sp. GXU_MW_B19 TaxID=3141326 RepID=UPI0031D6F928
MSQDNSSPDSQTDQKKARSFLGKIALFLLLLAVIAGGATAGGYFWLQQRFLVAGPLAEETVVAIPRGAGLASIARTLESEGVIEEALLFRIAVRLQGQAQRLKAGEFAIPAAASMQEVMFALIEGRAVDYSITIPEGRTIVESLALINANKVLEGEITSVPAEGYILPETYHFVRGDTRQGLLDRMTADLEQTLQELWAGRQADLPLNSPEEALILASIVEKETGLAEERPLVASVFVNRLRRGMRLQSDPTVIYGVTLGQEPMGRPISKKDLKTPTPYNTYTIDRLPPTPIANVGRAAIEAVLNPASSNYLYFVADGTGGHAFARTLNEHNRNVAKWRRIERQRKGG